MSGYTLWGSDCIPCTRTSVSQMVKHLLWQLAQVLFLLVSGSRAAGAVGVLTTFQQLTSLEADGRLAWLSWLRHTLVDISSVRPWSSTAACLAPWSFEQQTLATVLTPLLMLLMLLGLAGAHRALLACTRIAADAPLSDADDSDVHASRSVRMRAVIRTRLTAFSWPMYVGGAASILLLCYVEVTTACVQLLQCVSVGADSVVFTAPAVSCLSAEYLRYRRLSIVCLAVYTAGFPLAVLVWLLRHRSRVQAQTQSFSLAPPHRASAAVPSACSPEQLPLVQESAAACSSHHLGADAAADAACAAVSPSEQLGFDADADCTAAAAPPSEHQSAAVHEVSVSPLGSTPPPHPQQHVPSAFVRRWGPLFLPYRSGAWLWTPFTLLRRAMLVLASVLLQATPHSRMLALNLLNVTSLLLQLRVAPFHSSLLNHAEDAATTLLLLLGIVLTSGSPPYSDQALSIATALLVLPAGAAFLLLVPYEKRGLFVKLIARMKRRWGWWTSGRRPRQALLVNGAAGHEQERQLEPELPELAKPLLEL